jgi:predicted dehydrogenase
VSPPSHRSRFLIAGLGSIGRRHLRNLRRLRPEAEILLLRRPGSKPLSGEEAAWADGVLVHEAEALAAKPLAAVVATPAPFHLGLAAALAGAGCHLLIEKPLSHDLIQAEDFARQFSAAPVHILTGYCLRFDPGLITLRRALTEGMLGTVQLVRAEVGQYLPLWRPGQDFRTSPSAQKSLGGGVLLELSHEMDYLTWLLGEVSTLSAMADQGGDWGLDVEDRAEIQMLFASGVLGSVGLNFLQRPPVRFCRLSGEKGQLAWDALRSRVEFHPQDGKTVELLYDAPDADPNRKYLDEMDHFLQAVEKGTPVEPGLKEGLSALHLADAARRSAASGQRIVL